ncbi:hypothetical protein D3C80_1809730 [compost metagenome]
MQVGAVEVVGQERAAAAAFVPAVGEHEVVHQQLAATGEQVSQAHSALRAFKTEVLIDPDPGQGAAGLAQLVALVGQGFFVQ